ncbi:FAD-dependent oxidoreductase [Rhodococcus qingshengii]|uniref:FAD-dependent oxidoreductase n=1 Tax=Rhodococcus qingshengii TaxID=334542 RepID=UPI003661BA4C
MAFAITQNCCNDASCLSVCPVNCIHPTPDEPDFGKTDLLHIDPRACIDCGACADACPVEAITRVSRLTPEQAIYADVNAAYYENHPGEHVWDAPKFPPPSIRNLGELQVAIVGTGPAACYAAQALLRTADAKVTFFDRLPLPGGLARFGVAPDHTGTRRIGEHFRALFTHPRVTMRLGVEVGKDVGHAELAERYDSVVYAVGADVDRTWDLPGTELSGSVSARTLVGWYTGHPDVPADAVDLDGVERVVIVGNGNVALDAARILTADPEDLAGSEIASHALRALRTSVIREVVVCARRGPEHAAFTRSECQALVTRPGVSVVVAGEDDRASTIDALPITAPASALKGAASVSLGSEPGPGERRIVFAFGQIPVALDGPGRVTAVDLGAGVSIDAQLVLRAIGYQGSALPGVPFDDVRGTFDNIAGRVTGLDRTYVVGWAKRGANGGIGDNRADAEETVHHLVNDALARPVVGAATRRLDRVRNRNRST